MMNSLKLFLLELVQMSETPMYSGYCYLRDRIGHPISMDEYLEMVRDLIKGEMIHLWFTKFETQERVELLGVDPDLAEQYAVLGHTDPRYDPFCLSLTLGQKANLDVEPDWEVDFDFERGNFRLRAKPAAFDQALQCVGRYFQDLELVPERKTQTQGQIELVGRVQRIS